MLDSELVRKEPDRVRAGLSARGGRYLPAFEELLKLDGERRILLKEVESLRAGRNAAAQAIGRAKASKDEEGAKRLMAEAGEAKAALAAGSYRRQ